MQWGIRDQGKDSRGETGTGGKSAVSSEQGPALAAYWRHTFCGMSDSHIREAGQRCTGVLWTISATFLQI